MTNQPFNATNMTPWQRAKVFRHAYRHCFENNFDAIELVAFAQRHDVFIDLSLAYLILDHETVRRMQNQVFAPKPTPEPQPELPPINCVVIRQMLRQVEASNKAARSVHRTKKS